MTQREKKPKQGGASYEEKIKEVEDVLRKLEAGGTSLEESMDLFERGSRTLAECRQLLGASQRRMEVLLADLGEIAVMDEGMQWDTEEDGGTA